MPKRHSRSSHHGFWSHSKKGLSRFSSRLRSRRKPPHRRGLSYEFLESRDLLATLQHSLFPDMSPQNGAQTGYSVATDGNYHVVGSPTADVGLANVGMVRIFNAASGELVTTIVNPERTENDQFGYSVAVSGNTVVVGTPLDDAGGFNSGRAYLFNATTGALVATLNNPAPSENDQFGISVAISGNTVVVGSWGEDAGATASGTAYVFNATTGAIIRTLANPSPALEEGFGVSVAVSGNTAVVGALRGHQAFVFNTTTGAITATLNNPTPSSGDYYSGAPVAVSGNIVVLGSPYSQSGGQAHVFSATTGARVATLINPSPAAADLFGHSVAVSGTRIVIGAHGDNSSGGGAFSGQAYVYDTSSETPVATLANPTPATNEYFGFSVAVSGDIAVVGAHFDDMETAVSGRAYVFNAATGSLSRALDNPKPPATSDQYGVAIGLSGNTLVVGAYLEDTTNFDVGRAYVYNAATGALTATLSKPAANGNERFGTSVAVAGNLVVVGAPLDDAGAVDSGSAYVFNATTGARLATLQNPSPGVGDNFGISVAISGNLIVVGAYLDDTGVPDSGRAYVFTTSGALQTTLFNPSPGAGDQFGRSVGISGNTVVVGAYMDDTTALDSGQASVFNATTGQLLGVINNPTPASGDQFGFNVAISGSSVIVGAISDDAGATNGGRAYIFNTAGALVATLSNPSPEANDQFGWSVAIDANSAVVGAVYDNAGAIDSGQAYIFNATNGALVSTIANPTPAVNDVFGNSVAISGNRIAVGALGDNTAGFDQGAAYVFTQNQAPLVTLNQGTVTQNEGSPISNGGSYNDLDLSDNVTFSVIGGPGTVTKTGTNSGLWNWSYTPPDGPAGPMNIVIRADDGNGGIVDRSFLLNVTNLPPNVTNGGPVTVVEGSTAMNSGTWSDPGADVVTLSASAGAVTRNSDGTWDWLFNTVDGPDQSQLVTITAIDSDGAVATTSFNLTVNNAAPAITTNGTSVTISEGSTASWTGSFTDPGSDTWTATVDYGDGSGAQPLALSPIKTFSLSHVYTDDGSYTVTVTVSDDDGGSSSVQLGATVNNIAPLVVFDPVSAINEDGVATLTGRIIDPSVASSALINFEDLAHSGFGVGPTFNSYSSNGFTFQGYSAGVGVGGDSLALASMGSNTPGAYPGSASLVNRFFSGTTVLSRDNGQSFDLLSLDLSEANVDSLSPPRTITFFGTKSNGAVVSKSVVTNGTFGFQPVVFTDFTDVTSVRWTGLSCHIDNVRVQHGRADTYTLFVNWGDSLSPDNSQTITFGSSSTGSQSFTLTHRYRDDNPSGTTSDLFSITASVMDDDNGFGKDSKTVLVTNDGPTPFGLSIDQTVVEENGLITFTGSFTDPGSLDTHEVLIQWGDGSEPTELQLPVGARTFSATHRYLDDNPTGTTSDQYTIEFTLTDDDGGFARATMNEITVENEGPTDFGLSIDQTVIDENGLVTLTGSFTDPGTLDSHEAVIDWGDGSPPTQLQLATGARTFTATHRYLDDKAAAIGSSAYTIAAALSDDDSIQTFFESATLGNTGSTSAVVHVNHGQFLGVRFEVTSAVAASGIGGHFVTRFGDTNQMFAAIVALSGPDDFPDTANLSSADVVGSTLITVSSPSDEYSAPIDVDLEPGWYALVFGTGILGSGFDESGVPAVDVPIGSPSYFYRDASGNYFSDGFSNVRMFLTATAQSTASTTVTVHNVAPVAQDDEAATDEDTVLTLAAPGLLANDTDVGTLDVLRVVGIDTSGTQGLVIANADGSFTYDPAGKFDHLGAGETAIDRFTYVVSDGEDRIVFDNGELGPNSLAFFSNTLGSIQVAADDFTLSAGEDVISEIRWIGPASNAADQLVVEIHADKNGQPGTPIGQASVYRFEGHLDSVPGVTSGKSMYSLKNVDLQLTPGTKYWLSIYATNTGWSWWTTDPPNPDSGSSVTFDGTTWGRLGGPPNDFNYEFIFASRDEATVTVTVEGVNDAPVVTAMPSLATDEDTPLVIEGLAIADKDAGNDLFQVRLSVAHGGLVVRRGPAGLISGGDITFTATVAEINNAFTFVDGFTGVTYVPLPNYNGPDTLVITVDDLGNSGSGGSLTSSKSVAIDVRPVNDAPVARAGNLYTIAEGETLMLDVTASSDPDGDLLSYSWDLNNDDIFGDATGARPIVEWAALQALTPPINDNGGYAITLRVSDGHSHTDGPSKLQIANAPPSVTISTNTDTIVPGETVHFVLSAEDASAADQTSEFTYFIDWTGDWIVDETIFGPSSVVVEHVFTEAVSPVPSVVARDKDGDLSLPTSHNLIIKSVKKTARKLYIGGSTGNDEVQVTQGSVIVRFFEPDGNLLDEFRIEEELDEIVVYGQDGDDHIQIDSAITQSVEVFAGPGDDTISAGGGPSILHGEEGSDTLIGGVSTNELDGGDGDDVLQDGGGVNHLSGGSGANTFVPGGGTNTFETATGNATPGADPPQLVVVSHATGNESDAIPLPIWAGLTDTSGSEVLSLRITGVPDNAVLSAGDKQSDGSWMISTSELSLDLAGLTITADDNSTFDLEVTATAAVSSGATATTTATIHIDIHNVAPTANAGGPYLTFEDVPVTLSASGTDAAGSLDPLTFDWDLDNNGSFETAGANVVFNPAALGLTGSRMHTVNLRATDDANAQSVTASTTVRILGQGVTQVEGVVYVVSGSTANDIVNISRVGSNIRVVASFNNYSQLNFAESTVNQIHVRTRGGNDIVNSTNITKPMTIDGGAGNDILNGGSARNIIIGDAGNDILNSGSGDDVLLGGAGNDTLNGAGGNDVVSGGDGNDILNGDSGRDVIIGGQDLDVLNGGNDEDILVGGNTAHDNSVAALDAVMAVWKSTASFDSRVATLSGAGGLLGPGVTVLDDDDRDTINGGAGRDLIFGDTSNLDGVMDSISLESTLDTLLAVI
jgi:VCBS repeat-containing protein